MYDNQEDLPLDKVLKVLLNKKTDLVFYPGNVGDICGPGANRNLVIGEPLALVIAGRTQAL